MAEPSRQDLERAVVALAAMVFDEWMTTKRPSLAEIVEHFGWPFLPGDHSEVQLREYVDAVRRVEPLVAAALARDT